MASLKPKFDPSKPFEAVDPAVEPVKKPKFDASKPFEAVDETPKIGKLDTVVAGLQQAPFGFGDEASGFIESQVAPKVFNVTNNLGLTDVPIVDVDYEKARDHYREIADQASKDRPGLYYTTQILGGMGVPIPGLGSAGNAVKSVGSVLAEQGLKQALIEGAKQGAKTALIAAPLASAGSSKADLVNGQVGDFAKDVAYGTAIGIPTGAAFGAAVPAAVRGTQAANEAMQEAMKKIPDSLRRVASSVGEKAKSIFADLQGINKETIETYGNRGDLVDAIRNLGDTSDEATANYVEKVVAPRFNKSRSQFVVGEKASQAQAIANAESDGLRFSKDSVNTLFDQSKAKLAPKGIAPGAEEEATIQALNDAQSRFGKAIGDSNEVSPQDLKFFRTSWKNKSKAAFDGKIGTSPTDADAFKNVYLGVDTMIDDAIPAVNASNQKLSDSINAQKMIAHGFDKKGDVNSKDMMGLFRMGQKSMNPINSSLNTVDNLMGTNLQDQIVLNRTMQQVYPDISLSRYMTGRSTYPGKIFGGLSSVLGGSYEKAQAVGDALSTAMVTRPIIKMGYKTKDLALQSISGLDNLGQQTLSPVMQQITNLIGQLPAETQSRIGKGVLTPILQPMIQSQPPQAKSALMKEINDSDLPSTTKSKLLLELNKAQ